MLAASISSQAQNERGNFAVSFAASAFGETALKDNPGGSIRPFCEPATVTSTPHSSMRKSIDASDEIVSTSSNAGCPARSIALRTSPIRLATPVEVSLCTTQTALIA